MNYDRNNFRGGDDRWRDRERSYGQDRGGFGRDRHDNDRGFFDRAGDEVRSWFGDDDAERRREADARRYEREHGSDRDRWSSDYGRGTAGGWGNQRGWNDDRFERGFEGDTDRSGRFGRAASSGVIGYEFGRDRGGRGTHDPHYSEWRQRQISALDRDYDDYRRENQSRFEQEFGSWRDKRQGQRQSLGRVNEHMEVIGSDGQHVGKVDHVRDDRIILAKNDEAAGGRHHSIPCGWIDSVDSQVKINKTADEAMRSWREEERSRALFEREDQGSDGPHALNRSFSGTYSDR